MQYEVLNHTVNVEDINTDNEVSLSEWQIAEIEGFISDWYREGQFEGEDWSYYGWYIDFDANLDFTSLTIGQLKDMLEFYESTNWYLDSDVITLKDIKNYIK